MMIRKAEERDIETLLGLYDGLYKILIEEYGFPFNLSREDNREVLSVQIRSKLCCILVAEDNGSLFGFVHASISRLDRRFSYKGQKTLGHIDDIYVSDELRGSGTAQLLLDGADKWFREEGVEIVESNILSGNERSRRFHEKNGFKTMSRLMYKDL